MKILTQQNYLCSATLMRSAKKLVMRSDHSSSCGHDHSHGASCNDPTHGHSHHDNGSYNASESQGGHNHNQKGKEKNNNTIPIIGGIIALAAAAYLIYDYFFRNTSTSQENTPKP